MLSITCHTVPTPRSNKVNQERLEKVEARECQLKKIPKKHEADKELEEQNLGKQLNSRCRNNLQG
jgi:hypothetical protein